MERVLVSACLLGVNCRYSGRPGGDERVTEEAVKRGWIPVCPEILGGLPTPRIPNECLRGRVIGSDGSDNTAAFERGAGETLRLAELYGVGYALLKERSPSCGRGEIYDGTFTHTRVPGSGVTARLLKANGIRVFGESELDQLIEILEGADEG